MKVCYSFPKTLQPEKVKKKRKKKEELYLKNKC